MPAFGVRSCSPVRTDREARCAIGCLPGRGGPVALEARLGHRSVHVHGAARMRSLDVGFFAALGKAMEALCAVGRLPGRGKPLAPEARLGLRSARAMSLPESEVRTCGFAQRSGKYGRRAVQSDVRGGAAPPWCRSSRNASGQRASTAPSAAVRLSLCVSVRGCLPEPSRAIRTITAVPSARRSGAKTA